MLWYFTCAERGIKIICNKLVEFEHWTSSVELITVVAYK